jgi:hypothetical protein
VVAEVVVPPLLRVPNVELIHAGTWPAGGEGIGPEGWTASVEDLAAAVAALDCPSIRRPVIKFGHVPETPGAPAIGWVDNLGVVEGGNTLVGDLVGMPGWLAPILASAYPSRSIEGYYDLQCQVGHTHPFVVTAVALLGVEQPAVGTLEALHDSPLADLAALYGVAVAATAAPVNGVPITVTVPASVSDPVSGGSVPNPRPRAVAATATADDVRRAYYDDAPWSHWITEVQLDPLQLVVVDDDTARTYRVPVVLDAAADGVDAVSFGAPVEVVVRYEDVAAAVAATRRGPAPIRYASKAESRQVVHQPPPGRPSPPRPGSTPRASADPLPQPTGGTDVQLTDKQMTALRQRLGLPADADDTAIATALSGSGTSSEASAGGPDTATDPDTADGEDGEDGGQDGDQDGEEPGDGAGDGASAGEQSGQDAGVGTVTLDADAYADLVAAARDGSRASADAVAAERQRLVDAAVNDGRIPPARRDAWLRALEADPGSAQTLASLQPGLVPLREVGHANPAVSAAAGGDGTAASPYDALYGAAPTASRKA